jgi:phosphomevalonate kinase
MKKLISTLFVVFALFTAVQAQEKKQWKEMHDFHGVMGSTFHPAEDGNLQPIRTRSQEMVEKAEAWKNSDAPEGYDKKAVKPTLKKLVAGSKEIDKLVKANASDKELTDKLTALHDVFHEIMEKCRKK